MVEKSNHLEAAAGVGADGALVEGVLHGPHAGQVGVGHAGAGHGEPPLADRLGDGRRHGPGLGPFVGCQ